MSGAKRNADTLNTVGIVVVGICGAVLVYVTITALQAFYVNDTSDIQTMADYGGNDVQAKKLKADQMGAIRSMGPNTAGSGQQTYRISIDDAKKLVVDPKADPGNLVPMIGPSNKPSIQPIFGRPKALPNAAGSGSAAGSADGSAAGSGSATDVPSAPMTPTGNGGGSQGPAAGASPALPPTAGTENGSAVKGNEH